MCVAGMALFRKQSDSGLTKTKEPIRERETFVYKTYGTCSKEIHIEVSGNIVEKVSFIGGCPGGLEAIGLLVSGMTFDEIISKLQGISCRNNTSCPDQLINALKQIRSRENDEHNGYSILPY